MFFYKTFDIGVDYHHHHPKQEMCDVPVVVSTYLIKSVRRASRAACSASAS